MIAIIMMVVGAILAIVGFLGLLSLMFEPLYTMYMVIFRRKDDYVYYETKPGKALLQKNKKALRSSCIFFLILGLLLFAAGWFFKFGPRGTDSLFSKKVEAGTEKGDYVDKQGNTHTEVLYVRGEVIQYKDQFTGTLEEFEAFLKQLDGKTEFYLVDDFAAAKTYHALEELLTSYGFTFESEGEGA